MPDGSRSSAGPVRVSELDWRSAALLVVFFAVLVIGRGLLKAAPRTITWLALAALLALALNPLVDSVSRRLRCHRAVAVAVVVPAVAIVLAAAVSILAPPAIRQARRLPREVPRITRQLGDLPIVGESLRRNDAPHKAEHWIDELPHRITTLNRHTITRVSRRVVGGALALSATALLTITLLVDAPRLGQRVRRLVPANRQDQADRMGRLAYEVVGKYVAGSLVMAAVTGTAVLVFGLIARVPLTPLLAVWAGLWDLVPQIGGAIGGIPFVAFAFTRGAVVGVIAAVFFIVYLQVKHSGIQPFIIGRAVSMSPPATMIAALVGGSAAGLLGAILAVPVVGAVKAVYLELRPRTE